MAAGTRLQHLLIPLSMDGVEDVSNEVRQLRNAVMTAHTMSFSRAAAALNVKRSRLSKRIIMEANPQHDG
jgi:hypothetical protein